MQEGKKIPIHGDGSYVRDWIYVKDNADGILTLIEKQIKNDTFNLGSGNRIKNLDVVKEIINWFGADYENSIQFVPNRWGQDVRYALNTDKITSTGWKPKHPQGIYKWFN
jgi:dTDP-glucose 4,6-dehydratase